MTVSPHARLRRTGRAASLFAGALLCGAAHAQTTYSTQIINPFLTQVDSFSTTTDITSPVFNRPAIATGLNIYNTNNPAGSSGVGTAVGYATHTFTPASTGTYVINTSASGFDPGNYIQYIYSPTFDPSTAAKALKNVKTGYYPANASNSGSYSLTGTAATAFQFVNAGYYNDTAALNVPGSGTNSVGTATTTVSLYNAGSLHTAPDNSATGTSQTLTISDTGTVTSFNSITINSLTNSFAGDLLGTLTHNGITVDLFDHVGANNDPNSPGYNYGQGSAASFNGGDYTFSLTGADLSAVPDFTVASNGTPYAASGNAASGYDTANAGNTLAAFNGQSLSGSWILKLADEQPDDTSSFLGFSLNISAAPEPSQWASLAVGALGLGGLALRARRRRTDA